MEKQYDENTLSELPECICGKRNWKQDGLKIYCGNCDFILFKGFPAGSSDVL